MYPNEKIPGVRLIALSALNGILLAPTSTFSAPTRYIVDATAHVWFVTTCNSDGYTCSYPPPPTGMNVHSGDLAHFHFEYNAAPVASGPNYMLLENLHGGFLGAVTVNNLTWSLNSDTIPVTQASLYMSADTYANGLTYYQIEWRINSFNSVATPTFPFALGKEDITLNLRTTPPNTLFSLPPQPPNSTSDLNVAAFDSSGYSTVSSSTYDFAHPNNPYQDWGIYFTMPINSLVIQAIPEPQSSALFTIGFIGIGARVWRMHGKLRAGPKKWAWLAYACRLSRLTARLTA